MCIGASVGGVSPATRLNKSSHTGAPRAGPVTLNAVDWRKDPLGNCKILLAADDGWGVSHGVLAASLALRLPPPLLSPHLLSSPLISSLSSPIVLWSALGCRQQAPLCWCQLNGVQRSLLLTHTHTCAPPSFCSHTGCTTCRPGHAQIFTKTPILLKCP